VLVLQLSGEKRWLMYDPVLELPLKDQRYSSELGEPGQPVLDLTLRAGDTLYLPRGWLHEALTSDHDSLHLTVGVNSYTARDAVRAALGSSEEEIELRRAVPQDGELAGDLLERVAERLDRDAVAGRMRERFVSTRRPILDGQLAQLRRLGDLTAETPLERRPSVIADLQAEDTRVVLVFEGKRISFPAHAREEVEFVLTTTAAFGVSELPGTLDEPGRLVLVRRLIREGFLRAL
jgi:ribosomal protein L16 Arg81 hydroxylase